MSSKLLAGVAGCVLVMLGFFVPLLVTGGVDAQCDGELGGPVAGKQRAFDAWSAGQMTNAAAIVAAGKVMHMPTRAGVVALATAMQESGLKVYANDNPHYPLVRDHSLALPHQAVGHDHDSVGLFQQRPLPPEGEGAWGTVRQLMNPATSASKFYTALRNVAGWRKMPITQAAQQVQHSAYPDAYAKWQTPAERVLTHLLGVAAIDDTFGFDGQCGADTDVTAGPGGWVAPIKAPISSPFGPRGGALHAGVDLAGRRGTAIHAAAAGTVIYSGCDPNTGSCNIDGSMDTPGCGWYVEIRHAGNIVTRYCHQVRQPRVIVGQKVAAGQTIGWEGMSGNASGPHLHFEVHVHVRKGGSVDNSNAVDPVPFMHARHADLGKTS